MEATGRVLLVDDEPALLKVLGIKLRVSGFEVVTARDGVEALKLVEAVRPDILLLDVLLPGMDGLRVLEKLRRFSDLPVIVFSAQPENAQKAFSHGADDFLPKPFDVDDLVGRIDRLIDDRR